MRSLLTPSNSETTLVIDSARLDANVLGARFFSNFFAGLRSYEYQQHCPYRYMNYSPSRFRRALGSD